MKLFLVYGATELSPYVSGCYINDDWDHQSKTIGRPACHQEVKVVNHEGETLPVGEKGELQEKYLELNSRFLSKFYNQILLAIGARL